MGQRENFLARSRLLHMALVAMLMTVAAVVPAAVAAKIAAEKSHWLVVAVGAGAAEFVVVAVAVAVAAAEAEPVLAVGSAAANLRTDPVVGREDFARRLLAALVVIGAPGRDVKAEKRSFDFAGEGAEMFVRSCCCRNRSLRFLCRTRLRVVLGADIQRTAG